MSLGDVSVDDAWETVKGQVLIAWSKTTRRMRAAGAFIIFAYVLCHSSYQPSFSHLHSTGREMLTDRQASMLHLHPAVSAIDRPAAAHTNSAFQ